MSKISEVLRKVEEVKPKNSDLGVYHCETSILWPRFTKVFEAIASSIESQLPVGIYREFRQMDWHGADEGIHDHNGFIRGQTNGIELSLNINGVTIDDQTRYEIGQNGKWHLIHMRERYIDIKGAFVCADRRRGAVEMQHEANKWNYMAFWLEEKNTILQLEQIVSTDGVVFEARKLDVNKSRVTIPGTRITLDRFVR